MCQFNRFEYENKYDYRKLNAYEGTYVHIYQRMCAVLKQQNLIFLLKKAWIKKFKHVAWRGVIRGHQ